MDDFERQVIDAILDGDPGETVMKTPCDKWVSLKHIYPCIAAALRATASFRCEWCSTMVAEAEAAGLAALKGDTDG